MAESAQKEIHNFLDDLCKQDVYGSVTFFFKKGEITLIKDQLEYNTREVIESYSGSKPRRVLVIPKKRPAQNAEEPSKIETESKTEGV